MRKKPLAEFIMLSATSTSFLLQIIIYEKPLFEGRHVEIESEIFMLDDKESEEKTRLPLKSVGSMKVLGGV